MKTGPKEIYQSLEDYDGKIYNPFTNEIHILKGKDSEFQALMKGRIEAERRDKITYKISALTNYKTFVYFYTAITAIFLIINVISFIAMLVFSVFLIFCRTYEEGAVNKKVYNSIHSIQEMNGGEANGQ